MKLSDIDMSRVDDPVMVRALQRRAEAEQQYLHSERRRQSKTGENSADKLAEALMKGIKAASNLQADDSESVDLEGTRATFADRTGRMAPDAVTAKRGGVGVSEGNDPDAPDMSFGQGPGHSHPDLRGPNEEEAERSARVVRNEPVENGKRGPGRPKKNS